MLYKIISRECYYTCICSLHREVDLSISLIEYYDTKHQSGIAVVINSDTIPVFAGVNEEMKEDLIVANLFGVRDLRLNQILSQLNQLERPGLCFSLAGRDFPSHVTIKVIEGGLKSSPELVQNIVYVSLICFNRLILDSAGNIFLANEIIPSLISDWRYSISRIAERCGGTPKPLPIIHSTIARFTQAQSVSGYERKRLVELVNFWNLKFKETPLSTYTESIFVGTVYDLLKP